MSFHRFESMLAPLAFSDFIRNFWERLPVYVPGSPDKFTGLFDRETLLALLQPRQGSLSPSIGYLKAGRDEMGQHTDFQAAPERAQSLLSTGYTIQIEDIDRYFPPLQNLLAEARRALSISSRMNVACFLSPVASGYGLHFDASAMWVMQVSGQKRWWYSPAPAIAFPQENSIPTTQEQKRGIHGYKEGDLIEKVLLPGDVLYLPAGVWHRVQAVEESLHLCLSLFPKTALDLLVDLLRERMLGSEEWRRPVNYGLSPSVGPEELEREIERVLSVRLEDMRGVLNGLRPNDLMRLWRQQVS